MFIPWTGKIRSLQLCLHSLSWARRTFVWVRTLLGLASMRPCMVIFDIVVSGPEEGGDGVFAQEVSAGW
jgi:hypothetical protein